MNRQKKLIASAAFAMAAMTPVYVATEKATANTTSFYDVHSDDYFAEAVIDLASRGIVSGYQGYFSPNRDVTRGEAVKILYGIINPNEFEPDNAPVFIDVDTSHMFYKQIAYLSDLKIINGTGGAQPKFNPDAPIKREEMAIMIQRAFELSSSDASGPEFTDMREPYKEAIELLYVNGITKGISETEFGSQQNVTRGQIAVFLYKAENRLNYTGHYFEGTIEEITNTYVKIDGRKYEIPTTYEQLFSLDNRNALIDSIIHIYVNKQTINEIITLDLRGTSSKSEPLILSGDSSDWPSIYLTVSSPYVKLDVDNLHTITIGEGGKYVDFNGQARQMILDSGVNKQFTLTGSGQIIDFYQSYADEVDLNFNGVIGLYYFDSGHSKLTVGSGTTINFLKTDIQKELLESNVSGISQIETIDSSYGDQDESEAGSSEDDWEEPTMDDNEFVDDEIINPDFQGPFDGVINAIEDGQLKVDNQWVSITGQMNEFFNLNAEMLIGTKQFMRAFKGEVTSIDMLIIEKSGTIQPTSYYEPIDVRSLRVDADNVEINSVNVSNNFYLSDQVKTSFAYKYGQSQGEFTIENEDVPNEDAVNSPSLVLTFAHASIENLKIHQPNRHIVMNQTVDFSNLAIDVPENTLKRYPTIEMTSMYDELSFSTRLAYLTGASSFIESEMYPHAPKIQGNAIVEELNLNKGEVEWLAEGMIHSFTSYADEKMIIGENVQLGSTYDRFGDQVSGQFLVKDGKKHKDQLNVEISDTHYVLPTLTPVFLNYGEYVLNLLGAKDKKVLYRLASPNTWDQYNIGDVANGQEFINPFDNSYITYWHDKELMIYIVDEQNRIISKQIYNHVEGRHESFELEFMNEHVSIQSTLSASMPTLDYLYYFLDGELKGVEEPNLLKWANDEDTVNRLIIPEPKENYSEIWYPLGFIYTMNGEQHIQQFNDHEDSHLKILPGLGKDYLANKTEGSMIMTKHIIQNLYAGSPYVPKGIQYDFILKQYMADFSEEENLTMKRIGEIVPFYDKTDTNLKHIQHISQVRSLMINFEHRIKLMLNEGRMVDAQKAIDEMRDNVDLVREDSLRIEYMEILNQVERTLK